MANVISLYGLISVNGVYPTAGQPNLSDLTSEKVAYVSVVKAQLQDNTLVDAFEIKCSNIKGKEMDTYLLKVDADHCADIDAFFTGLTTVGSDITFKKYTSLKAINGAITKSKSVIISELHTKNSRYIHTTNTTKVFVDIHNSYQAMEFEFAGNQTVAGAYTYFPA